VFIGAAAASFSCGLSVVIRLIKLRVDVQSSRKTD